MKLTRTHARTAAKIIGRLTWSMVRFSFTVLAGLTAFAYHYFLGADDDRGNTVDRDHDRSRDDDTFDFAAEADRAWMAAESEQLRKKNERR